MLLINFACAMFLLSWLLLFFRAATILGSRTLRLFLIVSLAGRILVLLIDPLITTSQFLAMLDLFTEMSPLLRMYYFWALRYTIDATCLLLLAGFLLSALETHKTARHAL